MSDYYTKNESDLVHHEIRGAVTTEIQALQNVMKTQIDGLATKEDAAEIMRLVRSINFGIKFSQISWNVIVGIGGFIAAIGAIFVFFKFILAGLITWALTKA